MIPNMYHLPLKIVHGFSHRLSDPFEDKINGVRKTLHDLKDMGFGGIVTDVSFEDYLRNEEEWQVLQFACDEAERIGMRLWIYDERGYPSGKAGGLTLAENPDFEARGVVIVQEELSPGETKTLDLPVGHEHFLYAAVYPTYRDGEKPSPAFRESLGTADAEADVSPLIPDAEGRYIPLAVADGCRYEQSVTLTNPSDGPAVLCAFIEKHLYEGTHCIHNVSEARRYIDVTNRDAVAAFLRNTYDRYAEKIPDHMRGDYDPDHAPIGQVEAFFTDEPSFMGCYINAGLFPPETPDPYNPDMPLSPVLSYGRDVENAFQSRYGYDIKEEFVSIFLGDTPHADRVRNDYFALLSDLYEESFFSQISDWCARHGVNFSGHLLLEDLFLYHTVFEGNFFSLLRHMQTPGIDMLQSIPSIVRDYALTPKLVSSVAHAYRRPHVMSEVSAHAQGGKVTRDQMYASLCLQYALGVDVFTSYYGLDLDGMNHETYRSYNEAIGRIGAIMEGTFVGDALLYYPIETFRLHHRPSDAQYGCYTAAERACDAKLTALMNALLDRQVDFDFIDCEALDHMQVSKERFLSPSGLRYKALIVPPMETIPESARMLADMEARGTVIRVKDFRPGSEDADALIRKLHDGVSSPCALESAGETKGLVRLIRDTAAGRACLLVNTNECPVTATFTIHGLVNPVLYDPLTDETVPCTFEPTGDGHRFTATWPSLRSLIIREK